MSLYKKIVAIVAALAGSLSDYFARKFDEFKQRGGMLEPSKKFKQSLLKFSYGMSAKMFGILSLSTSAKNNPRCMARANCGNTNCVCTHCFACDVIDQYSALANNLNHNSDILANRLLTEPELKAVCLEIVEALKKNGTFQFRLESFGDIANVIHARNYINICAGLASFDYPVFVAWWTKNIDLLLAAWKDTPEKDKRAVRKNTTVILSSLFVNVVGYSVERIAQIEKLLGMPVKVFTVYTKEYAAANGTKINCGARSCLKCRRCYFKTCKDRYVNELLKKRGKR